MQSVSSFFQRNKVKNSPQLNKVMKTQTTEDKILTSRQDEHSVKNMTRKFEALFNENASSQPAHTPGQNEEIKAGHVKEMKEFYQSKSKHESHKPMRSNSFIQKRERQNNTVSSKEPTDLNSTSILTCYNNYNEIMLAYEI